MRASYCRPERYERDKKQSAKGGLKNPEKRAMQAFFPEFFRPQKLLPVCTVVNMKTWKKETTNFQPLYSFSILALAN